jgi:hypothetical protein
MKMPSADMPDFIPQMRKQYIYAGKPFAYATDALVWMKKSMVDLGKILVHVTKSRSASRECLVFRNALDSDVLFLDISLGKRMGEIILRWTNGGG